MIFVGIDWSTRFSDVCIIDSAGKIIKEFQFKICRDGFATLLDVLSRIGAVDSFHIGIEDGNNIAAHVLRASGYKVYALNPKRVSRFKDRYSAEAKKDDRFDAYNIALILLKDGDTFLPMTQSTDVCEDMKIHCETIRTFVSARTRIMNQLWAELALYFPAFLGFFTDMNSNVSMNVLKLIADPEKFKDITEEKFVSMLKPVRYMGVKRKRKLYLHLTAQTVHVKTPGQAGRVLRARIFADQILSHNISIRALEKEIAKLFGQHELAPVFKSLPGAGKRLAPGLLALMGDDKTRFNSYQRLQCYAGSCPITEKSGKSFYKVSMRKACNKSFRHALYLFSFTTLRTEPWAREYYDLMKKRGKSHSVAIRALANKWAKIIFAMWKENQPYKRERFLENRKIDKAA